MEDLEALIPEGVQSGDNVIFTLPNGRTVQFIVPRNVTAGQRVLMKIPEPTRLEKELALSAETGAPVQQKILMDMYEAPSDTIQTINVVPIPRASPLIQDNLVEINFFRSKELCAMSSWLNWGYMRRLSNYPNNCHIRDRIDPLEWKKLSDGIIAAERDIANKYYISVLLVERYGWIWICLATGIVAVVLSDVEIIAVPLRHLLFLGIILVSVLSYTLYRRFNRIREHRIASSIAEKNHTTLKPLGLAVRSLGCRICLYVQSLMITEHDFFVCRPRIVYIASVPL